MYDNNVLTIKSLYLFISCFVLIACGKINDQTSRSDVQLSDQYAYIDNIVKDHSIDSLMAMQIADPMEATYKNIKILEWYSREDIEEYDSLKNSLERIISDEFTVDPLLAGKYSMVAGLHLQKKFQFEEATLYFKNAFDLYDHAGPKAKEQSLNALLEVALTHQYYGGSVDSAEYYALRLQDSIESYGQYEDAYFNLYTLADIYRRTGSLELAKYWAIQARQELLSHLPVDTNQLADIEVVIGNIELSRFNYKNSMILFRRGIKLKRSVNRESNDLLYFYNNFLSLLLNKKELNEASKIIYEFQSHPGSNQDYWQYMINKHIGYLSYLEGDYANSIDKLLLAQKISLKLPLNDEDLSNGYELIGTSFLKIENLDKAIENFTIAREVLNVNENISYQSYRTNPKGLILDILIAHCKIQKGNQEANLIEVQEGLKRLEKMEKESVFINMLFDPVSALSAQDYYTFLYDTLIDYYLKDNNSEVLFELIDLKKSGFYNWTKYMTYCDLTNSLIFRILDLDHEIRKEYQKSYDIKVNTLNTESVSFLVAKRNDLVAQLLESEYSSSDSLFNCIKRIRRDKNLKYENLDDTAIINYYYNKNDLAFNRLIAAVYFKGDYFHFNQEISTPILNVIDTMNSCVSGGMRNDHSESVLFNFLLEPIYDRISKAENIIVLNDGPLHEIPIEAIRRSCFSQPLFTEHVFSYAYALKDIDSSLRSRSLTDHISVISFSDKSSISSQFDPVLRELPGTHIETRCIMELFGDKVQRLTGMDVTWPNIQASVGDVGILHIGLHGQFDGENLLNNKLFIRGTNGEPFEPVYISDLLELDMHSELLVLSACHSTSGQNFRSLGTISFARELSEILGSSSISYLWELDDMKAADVMCLFYKELIKTNNPIESLQKAKIQFSESNNYEHSGVINGLVYYH